MLAFVIPTRNRPDDLAATLHALGRLPLGPADAEVIVVDNASDHAPTPPTRLASGLRVTLLRRPTNEGAAARNAGAEAADHRREWIVMLDDDSAPIPAGPPLTELLHQQPPDVAAVMADIRLPAAGTREAGGLPEVFIGCGVAIRRRLFLSAGGYDPDFNYYVEEYDLAARLLAMGYRVAFEPRWRVDHRKIAAGRDMDRIVERLVRNNGWVAARYAPDAELDRELAEIRARYRAIAIKEGAIGGYDRGLAELDATLDAQPRLPLERELWDRFTGLAHARNAIAEARRARPFETASIVAPGKNAWAVRRALEEAGVEIAGGVPGRGEALVIGTLSPGPMLDAADLLSVLGRRVVAPWLAAETAAEHLREPELV